MNKQQLFITIDTIGYSLFGHRIRNSQFLKSVFGAESYILKLKQANISVPYYIYLSRIILASLLVSIIGVVIGLFTGVLLSPQLSQLSVGLTVYSPLAIQIIEVIKDNIIFIVPPIFSIIFGFFVFGASYITLAYIPTYLANERERKIEQNLPHIASMMYAGSGGSSNTLKAFRKVSESTDLYGETAIESQKLINKIDNSNKDLMTAIKELKKETPSEELNRFLSDLENKIDQGASKTTYFNRKTRDYQDNLFDKRQTFTESISSAIRGLLFVVFGLVIANIGLYFQSFTGSGGALYLSVLNYGIIPLFSIIASVVLYMFISSATFNRSTIQTEYTDNPIDIEYKALISDITNEKEYTNYAKNVFELGHKLYKLDQIKNNAFKILLKNPHYTLPVTIPVTILLVLLSIALGFVTPSVDAFVQDPITQTVFLIGLPIFGILLPISALYEYNAKIEKELEEEFRSFLRRAEANNKVNGTLVETIKKTSKSGENRLSYEMEKAYNKISWTGQINRPLTEFANELKMAKISRSIKLLKMANEISGQIDKVLDVSERDVDNMISIKETQKRDTLPQIVMVLFIFITYIAISIILEITVITTFTEQLQSLPDGAGARMPIPVGGDMDAPIKLFSLLYYHQSISFGVFIGPVIGLIRNNNALAGLKYSILFFTLTTIGYASKFLLL